MRIAFVDDFRPALVRDDSVIDISDITDGFPGTGPQDLMNGLIADFDRLRPELEEALGNRDGVPMSSVRFRPPLPLPGKLVCMAGNYMEGGTIPKAYDADAFLKSPSSVIGDGDTIVLPDAPASVFHHEAELGVVIGKTATKISEEDASEYIFGYVNFGDVSARGITPEGRNSFWWQKSWDTFCPIGPWILTSDEVPDPQKLEIKLWNNGDLRQDFNTDDMARGVTGVVEFTSALTTLHPGDILATGTNHLGLRPIQDGETIEMEITGLGRITLNVQDTKKRTWDRDDASS